MEKTVNPELVRRLTEKAAEEFRLEIAGLIPQVIADIPKEMETTGATSFPQKTVKIALCVELYSANAGRVYIDHSSWEIRAKRTSPGGPVIEVDLAQPELEFQPVEAEAEDAAEAAVWRRLMDFAKQNGCTILRSCSPDAPAPLQDTSIETWGRHTDYQWRRISLGSVENVARQMENAPDNCFVFDARRVVGNYLECYDDNIVMLLKEGHTPVGIYPVRRDGGEDTMVEWHELDGEDTVLLTRKEERQGPPTAHYAELLKDCVPVVLPWPPPKGCLVG